MKPKNFSRRKETKREEAKARGKEPIQHGSSICQRCKNRGKDKKCSVTGLFVARKKECDCNSFTKREE